jgi:hypothetical protein
MKNRMLTIVPLFLSWDTISSSSLIMRMILLSEAAVVAAAFSPPTRSGTDATPAATRRWQGPSSKKATVLASLQMNVNNNDDDNMTNKNMIKQQQRQRQQWKQGLAHKNFGGRASRGRKASKNDQDAGATTMISKNQVASPKANDSSRRGLWKLLAPIVGLALILRLLFGGTSGSYYYYQSSSYESSVVTGDGRVDTARKESVRTNLPGLVIEKASSSDDDRRSRASSTSSSTSMREEDRENSMMERAPLPSAAFDDALDREIESILRQERRMLDDFFY